MISKYFKPVRSAVKFEGKGKNDGKKRSKRAIRDDYSKDYERFKKQCEKSWEMWKNGKTD